MPALVVLWGMILDPPLQCWREGVVGDITLSRL